MSIPVLCLALLLLWPEARAASRWHNTRFNSRSPGNSWALKPVTKQLIETIDDLRDGVYSLELAAARPTSCKVSRTGR